MGCEWKSVIRCSRFDDINALLARGRHTILIGERHAQLIGERHAQFRGLIWFERLWVHGAVKPPGGGPLGRIAWRCQHKLSSVWRGVTTMPEPARRIMGGHLGGGGVQRGSQALDGSRRDGSQGGLDL